jgi:hypothetical protein
MKTTITGQLPVRHQLCRQRPADDGERASHWLVLQYGDALERKRDERRRRYHRDPPYSKDPAGPLDSACTAPALLGGSDLGGTVSVGTAVKVEMQWDQPNR